MLLPNFSQLKTSIYGCILYYLFAQRRKIALENIDRVYGRSLTVKQKKHLAKAFFSHIACSVKELILYRSNKLKPHIEIRGLKHLHQAIQNGKGVILLSGHFGNWELSILGLCPTISELKTRLYVLKKKQKWFVQKQLISVYKKAGIEIIDKKGARLKAYNVLKNQRILAFAFDQHLSLYKKQAIAAEFFGVKAGCALLLPQLVERTGASVIGVNQYRIAANHHVIEFSPSLPWLEDDDVEEKMYRNILQYNRILEDFILQRPEQWFWVHRRWKI